MSQTIHLREWIPEFAQRFYGTAWTPNHDMITHLQAQKVARTLGIEWAATMKVSDVRLIMQMMLRDAGRS